MKPRDHLTLPSKLQPHSGQLFDLQGREAREELERFRIAYEAEHGPTDFKRRYTSTLPTRQQQWLFANEQQVWFDGLPPFVQAFFKQKVEAESNGRTLAGTPGEWIASYLGGKVRAPAQSDRGR